MPCRKLACVEVVLVLVGALLWESHRRVHLLRSPAAQGSVNLSSVVGRLPSKDRTPTRRPTATRRNSICPPPWVGCSSVLWRAGGLGTAPVVGGRASFSPMFLCGAARRVGALRAFLPTCSPFLLKGRSSLEGVFLCCVGLFPKVRTLPRLSRPCGATRPESGRAVERAVCQAGNGCVGKPPRGRH